MARAKRHYLPGQIWHITHRCHQREFLLKFARDRRCWLQWLHEAKRRYDLIILNYIVTSNHIHLLVADDGDRETIPKSIQLIAGRTGQEYNQRKNRKGAYWEDRYHATAVERGEHLSRCLVYIDLNMVRAGKVTHPSEWLWCGYNEIQKPRRKNLLIDYERLKDLLGFKSYEAFKTSHREWAEEELKTENNIRDEKWTRSIAVGGTGFVENIKSSLGILAQGRKIRDTGEGFELRESPDPYGDHLGVKKVDIEGNNSHFWIGNLE